MCMFPVAQRMSKKADTIDLAEPLLPFFAAGIIVLYGINAGAGAMMNCMFEQLVESKGPLLTLSAEEYRSDPRNPYAKQPSERAERGEH